MMVIHVAGDSMYPTISSGSILFVDTAVTDRDQLDERLVVVAHRDLGFKAARLRGSQVQIFSFLRIRNTCRSM
jgi:phage repressor protein C with HTH and peptisase S24 domain